MPGTAIRTSVRPGPTGHVRDQVPDVAPGDVLVRLRGVAVLTSQLDRDAEEFARRRERMEELVAELRERTAQVARGGGEKATERHRSRGKLPGAGADRPARRSGHRLPRAERARRLGAVRRRRAERRDRHGHRRRRGPRVRDRRERRDRQGRLVLPAHREEAPARAGGGGAEPAPVPLPRRLGRRVPAAPGRGLPRPRPLRPDLLQPGADVGARASRRSRS